MDYSFDRIVKREGTHCLKFDKRHEVFGTEDIIPMWIADMDFEVAPCITEAIKERAEHLVYGYEFRSEQYYDAIMRWVDLRNGWEIQRDWIDFTPGVVAGLVLAMRAFTRESDGVVIQPPVYPPFKQAIFANDRKVVNNPLKCNGETFEIDFDDLDMKLSKAKALMLCNPHNPTGRVFTMPELKRIGELCVKHNVWIISDEIHSDLVRKPHRHIHIASISPEVAERTITLFAPSKTFNIAGLSTSVAVIPGERARKVFREELDKCHVSAGNSFGNVALEAAYNGCSQWLDDMMAYVGGNIDYVKKFCEEKIPSVKAYNCGATFLVWLDFTKWGMRTEELINFLVYKAGLGLNCGAAFGDEGRNFARMNVGTSRAVVERAMKQLYEASLELNL